MPEVQFTGQLVSMVQTALLQKHLSGGCTIDMPLSNCHQRKHIALLHDNLLIKRWHKVLPETRQSYLSINHHHHQHHHRPHYHCHWVHVLSGGCWVARSHPTPVLYFHTASSALTMKPVNNDKITHIQKAGLRQLSGPRLRGFWNVSYIKNIANCDHHRISFNDHFPGESQLAGSSGFSSSTYYGRAFGNKCHRFFQVFLSQWWILMS